MTRLPTLAASAVLALAQTPVLALTPDWQSVAAACHAADAHTQANATVDVQAGLVRSGRNPPLRLVCAVHHSGADAAAPDWRVFELQYLDANPGGGRVKATLRAKNRLTGKASVVASVTSLSGAQVHSRAVTLRGALDFSRYHYWVGIELTASALDVPVEAHAVALRP